MNRPTRESRAGRAYLDLQNLARRNHRPTDELLREPWIEDRSEEDEVGGDTMGAGCRSGRRSEPVRYGIQKLECGN